MDTRYLMITGICTAVLFVFALLEMQGRIRKGRVESWFAAGFDFSLVALNIWSMYMHCSIWGWQ